MIELITTILITFSSVLLFGYWFRYSCMLILSTRTTRDYASDVATANQLQFLHVQTQLQTNSPDLDRLRLALDHDYAVLARLLSSMSEASPEESAIEKQMLSINYRLMSAWYSTTGRFSASAARQALEEMSMVVAHMANVMGERAACSAAA